MSPVQQQAAYDSVFHQLQQAQHHFWQSTWHWIHHPNIKHVFKVIWHKTAPPLQTGGSVVFARWRQCAIPYGHIGTTWWIRFNLCFLRPTWVHNLNCKSISSAVFAQLKECRQVHWRPLVNTIELLLPPAHLSPQPKCKIDRFSRFLHSCRQKVHAFYHGRPFP